MEMVHDSKWWIVAPNQLQLSTTDIPSGKTHEVTVTADDAEHLDRMFNIAGSPLEEFDYGLYHENVGLKEVGDMIVESAREQLAFSKQEEQKKAKKKQLH